jgi:hypothetical protein
MLTVTTPGDTQKIVVPLHKLALVRAVLDLNFEAEDVEALKRLVGFGPERIRALYDLAGSQLVLEDVLEQPPNRRQLPVVADGRLVYPIACISRMEARRRGEAEPECTWGRDGCGVTCDLCAKWEGEETARGGFIAGCIDAGRDG